MEATRATSMCFEFPAIVVCILLTLFLLFYSVTDENSESESDTEEKLKGENRKCTRTFAVAPSIWIVYV